MSYNKLSGKNLSVVSITRQNLFDSAYIGCCDNCGKIIVNIATVKDIATNETYEIGLDCKKSLIDKKLLDAIMLPNDFDSKYKAKEYKREQNDIEKFLKLCAYPNVEITYDTGSIIITDDKPHKNFPGIIGNNIYMENIGYLQRIGLKEFIQKMVDTGKIKNTSY